MKERKKKTIEQLEIQFNETIVIPSCTIILMMKIRENQK